MRVGASTPEQLQRRYYEETSRFFDEWHMGDEEHNNALRYISLLIGNLKISSMLDVGCGTGRGVRYFFKNHASLKIHGVDPSGAQLDHAIQAGVSPDILTQYDGVTLPFDDCSFDAVCEFGALHHAPKPNLVVEEMIRVARKAVFISDCNRFGDGNTLSRVTKLLLWKAHLWKAADYIKTHGRGYTFSEGDGLAYSYSVYDSYELLAEWADKIILIPTSDDKPISSWFHPLLTSHQILVCAIRKS